MAPENDPLSRAAKDAAPAAAPQLRAAVYLLPVPLSTGSPANVLPQLNMALMAGIRHFAVENLRSARRFLRAAMPSFPIDYCTFAELSEHTPLQQVDAMLQPVRQGLPLGVISEAGCPAVADPGAALVAAAQSAGMEVIPLVGPSSIIMSLMASGFNGQNFAFCGYLPVEDDKRVRAIRQLERQVAKGQTQIFIETPYRNNRLLQTLARTLADTTLLCVACDITGPAQSIVTLPAKAWRSRRYDYNKLPAIFLLGTPALHP